MPAVLLQLTRLPGRVILRPLLVVIPLLLCQCGSVPGPGPTDAQVAARLQGRQSAEFPGSDGRPLGYVSFQPRQLNAHRAAFIYLHGIESHSGWFDEAARQLAAKGYPVFSIDRRGSGINRENRGFVSGHVERGIHLVDDVHRAVARTRATGRFEEIYLIGLSWGGKYAMAYDAAYPNDVDGLVLITPGMKPLVDLGAGEKVGVLIDSIVAPKRQHPTPIEPTMFTTTPEYLDYIINDPLRLTTVSAAFLMQSTRMDRSLRKLDDGPRPPILTFLAGQDRIIDNEATRKLVTRNPARNVTIIDYEDQTHSIQLDAPERLTRDIVKWIDSLPRN